MMKSGYFLSHYRDVATPFPLENMLSCIARTFLFTFLM